MTFLNAAFLLALPLAAVPVLVHLFKNRQRRVVLWGAMQFLVDAMSQGRRMQRFEELLLMLLRIAVVLALVLALARPMVRDNWIGSAPVREVVVVLDDSMSMSHRSDGGTAFDVARHRIAELLDGLGPDDLVQVVLASESPRWLTPEAVCATDSTCNKLKSAIAALQPTQGAARFFACLNAAVNAPPPEGVLARRIAVFTDGMAHGWQLDALPAWRDFQAHCQRSRVPISVDVIAPTPAAASVGNLAVTRLEITPATAGLNDNVTLRAEVKNTAAATCAATVLHWQAGRGDSIESLGSSQVNALKPGEAQTLEFLWRSGRRGVFCLGCRLDSVDAMPMDDEDFAVCEVVESLPVLLVDDSRKSTPSAEEKRIRPDIRFLTAALGYRLDDDGKATAREAWHSVFLPHRVSGETLATTHLSDYRTVVVTHPTTLPARVVKNLHEFVLRGGGLWIALSEDIDRDTFNSVWYDDGGGLCPLPLMGLASGDGQANENIHPPSPNHPATAQLSDTQRLDVDRVRIWRRERFGPGIAGQKVSALFETGTGEPLAVENYVGRGRVIVQALPFGAGGSNLALTKAYVVMVQDWLAYLTQPAATRFNLSPGAPIEFTSGGTLYDVDLQDSDVRVVLPDQTNARPAVMETEADKAYRFDRTSLPGYYGVRFTRKDQTLLELPFHVARDSKESSLAALTAHDRAALSDAAGVRFGQVWNDRDVKTTTAPTYKPVWTALLLALLAFLIFELAIAGRIARARATVASTTP
jgi:hypothetical protein